MPYARTFGALSAFAVVSWGAAFFLIFCVVGRTAPEALFIFTVSTAVTLTIVAAIVWMCSFAMAGRADLTQKIMAGLEAKAEALYWRMYTAVCEAVLIDNDGPAEAVQ